MHKKTTTTTISLPLRTLYFHHELLCKLVLGNPLLSVEAYSASAEQRVVNIKDPQLKIFIFPFSTIKFTSDNPIFFSFLTNTKQRCNKCLLCTYSNCFFVTFINCSFFVVMCVFIIYTLCFFFLCNRIFLLRRQKSMPDKS